MGSAHPTTSVLEGAAHGYNLTAKGATGSSTDPTGHRHRDLEVIRAGRPQNFAWQRQPQVLHAYSRRFENQGVLHRVAGGDIPEGWPLRMTIPFSIGIWASACALIIDEFGASGPSAGWLIQP